jgi:predicted CXXCH cytochrome family protein
VFGKEFVLKYSTVSIYLLLSGVIMKIIFLFFLPFLMCIPISYAQTLSVNTYAVSPRQVANDSVAHYFDRRFTGLQNVGNQTKVYLEVTNSSAKLNSPVWSFTSVPFGSAATFGPTNNIDTSNQVVYFIPDKVGTYIINVSDGSLSASITINSSLYVGIQKGACYICHNGAFLPVGVPLYTNYTGTAHASALKDGLNGVLSSHFNATCLECHTTGFDTLASNGGFDDYPFVFPDTLEPGMYDSLSQVYPDAMALGNVQCEACHGPGNNHYGDTTASHMVKSLSPQLCGYCHDATGSHEYYSEQYYASVHANPTTLQRGTTPTCARCHSGSGFVAYIEGGKQELTTAPPLAKIACAVCHDPHNATNSYQLRTETATLANGVTISGIGEGALCMNCHQARVEAVSYTNNYLNNLSHYGPHHGPQGDIIAGQNGYQFGWKFPTSPHMQAANGCIACHMAAASVNPDGSRQLFGSHSLNMVDPKTGNDNVAACAPCHGTSVGTEFSDKKFYVNGNADLDGDGVANGLQVEVQGLLNRVARLLPPLGDTTVVVDSTYTLVQAEAAYNWDMVTEDRSLGIHNPEYVYSLLAVSLQKLDPTTDIKLIDNTVPQTYSLDQNYPNPFNPTTTIKYSIPKEGNVKIQVFDITGRLVTTLVNANEATGTYSVTWNGRNSGGQAVSSGIYLYRLQSNDFVSVKKMVMLK